MGRKKTVVDGYKVCSQCKRKLPVAAYVQNRSRVIGIASECRECQTARLRAWRESAEGDKARRDYEARPERRSAYRSHAAQRRERALSDIGQANRLNARAAVQAALRRRKLTKPTACPTCGTTARRIHAHHYAGYEPEHWLTVQWACSRCHAREHADHERTFQETAAAAAAAQTDCDTGAVTTTARRCR